MAIASPPDLSPDPNDHAPSAAVLQQPESPLRRHRSTGVRPKPGGPPSSKSNPVAPSRLALKRANSTGAAAAAQPRAPESPPDISYTQPSPPLSDVQEERAKTLDKLTGPLPSMASFISSLDESDAATSYTDGAFTPSSAALADESSLASDSTATCTNIPRHQLVPVLSNDHGAMLQAASAFLRKELGQTALQRRPAVEPLSSFVLPADQEAHKLWTALQDGVLLLKLINSIFPSAATINRRDVPSAKRENVAKFLDIAQTKLFLHPNDLFLIDDLVAGEPSGFVQVCHTLLAIAQRIRPTSSPQHSPRRPSTALVAPSSSESEGSPIRPIAERRASRRGTDDLRRPAMRKAAISFAGDADKHHASHRPKFYGVERRMSESAIDLVSIEEEGDHGHKRRHRQSEGAPSPGSPHFHASGLSGESDLLPSTPPSSRPTSTGLARPSMVGRSITTPASRPESGDFVSFSALKPKVRRLSSGSSSSVPFPSSPIDTGSPARPRRPMHLRTTSEVHLVRSQDSELGRGRAESLSTSSSVTEDGRYVKRRSQSQTRQQISFNDGTKMQTYHLGGVIGSGQFGSVHKALDWNRGRVVAVKRIKLAGRSEEEIDQVVHEVDVLKRVAHPCIVKYEGLVRTRAYLNIIMEYVEGSLLDALRAYGEFSENLAASYVTQVLEGLSHLHQRGVVHCDLKCANILCTKSGNIKIGDFGVSLNLNTTRIKPSTQEDLLSGTPSWMAPEVIELRGASKASDIWSLGATILEMITGKPPFAELLSMSAMYHIVEKEIPIPATVTPQLYDFLSQCLAKDPAERPSAEDLSTHVWLSMNHTKEYRPQDSMPFFQRRASADPRYDWGSSGEGSSPGLDYSGSSLETASLNTNLSPGSPRLAPNLQGPELGNSQHRASGSDESAPPPVPSYALPQDGHTSLDLSSKERVALDRTPTASTTDYKPQRGRQHIFVKTSFGRAMECRVCQQTIKRKGKAHFCEGCGIICHQHCGSELAAYACDFRAALTAYSSPHSSHFVPNPAAAMQENAAIGSTPSLPLSPLSPVVSRSAAAPASPAEAITSHLAIKNPFKSRKPAAGRASMDGGATIPHVSSASAMPSKKQHTARSLSVGHVPSQPMAADATGDKRRRGRLSRGEAASGDCVIS